MILCPKINHPYTKNTKTKQNETERKHKNDLRDGENHGILIFTNGFCTLMETSEDLKQIGSSSIFKNVQIKHNHFKSYSRFCDILPAFPM